MEDMGAGTTLMYAGALVGGYVVLRGLENTARWCLWGKKRAWEVWRKEHVLCDRIEALEGQQESASIDRASLLNEDILVKNQLKVMHIEIENLCNYVGLLSMEKVDERKENVLAEEGEEIIPLHYAVDVLKEMIGKPEDQVTKEKPLEVATLFAKLNYCNTQLKNIRNSDGVLEKKDDKEFKKYIPLLKHLQKKRELHKKRKSNWSRVMINYSDNAEKEIEADSPDNIGASSNEEVLFSQDDNTESSSEAIFNLMLEEADKNGNTSISLSLYDDYTISPVIPKKQRPDVIMQRSSTEEEKSLAAQDNTKIT